MQSCASVLPSSPQAPPQNKTTALAYNARPAMTATMTNTLAATATIIAVPLAPDAEESLLSLAPVASTNITKTTSGTSAGRQTTSKETSCSLHRTAHRHKRQTLVGRVGEGEPGTLGGIICNAARIQAALIHGAKTSRALVNTASSVGKQSLLQRQAQCESKSVSVCVCE